MPTLHELCRNEKLETNCGRTMHRRVAAARTSLARQLGSKLDTGNRYRERNRASDEIRLAAMDTLNKFLIIHHIIDCIE